MNRNLPLVSVIIPTFNRANLAVEAVQSILAQTYKRWECLVVDDGSTDNTESAIQKLIGEHPDCSIRYLPQNNQGVASARNHGVREATGDFLQFLDSDDLLEPSKIERGVEIFEQTPDLDMVYCDTVEFSSEEPSRILASIPYDPSNFLLLNLRQNTCQPATFLWRRSSFERFGPFDTRLRGTEDWEHSIRSALCGARWQHLPEIGVRYRTHAGSRLTTVSEEWGEMRLMTAGIIHAQLAAQSKNHPPYTDALARFVLRVCRNLYAAGHRKKAHKALQAIKKLGASNRTVWLSTLFWWLQKFLGATRAGSGLQLAHRLLRSRGQIERFSPWLRTTKQSSSFRVLFFSESSELGGRERSMLHRALGIAKYGATVGVLCSDRLDLGPFRERAEKLPLGVHPIALTSRREYMFKAFRPSLDRSQRSRIREVLKNIQPDLLVLGQPGADDCHTAILAANDMKIPVVADVALLLDPTLWSMRGGGLRRWWIRRHYALCRSVVTNCRRNAELLEDLGCGASEHFAVIPTGIHAQDFPPCPSLELRARVREEIGLTPDRWAIGFVGRLSIEKGLDWLIEAFGVARKQHPSMELILIGDGPLRTSLQEQAEQTDIPIHFLGWRSEISELLWGLDAFILPSKIEAFPRVIMQAFSARIPVIATRVHGVPDMVRDGETGWLVEYGDTHQLVSTLAEISNNPEESQRRVDAAQALVHSELDLDHQQAKFSAYLKNLLLQGDS